MHPRVARRQRLRGATATPRTDRSTAGGCTRASRQVRAWQTARPSGSDAPRAGGALININPFGGATTQLPTIHGSATVTTRRSSGSCDGGRGARWTRRGLAG